MKAHEHYPRKSTESDNNPSDLNPNQRSIGKLSGYILDKIRTEQHPEEDSQVGEVVITGVRFVFYQRDLLDTHPETGEFVSVTSKADNVTRYISVDKINPSQKNGAAPAKRVSRKKGKKLMELNTPVADDFRYIG